MTDLTKPDRIAHPPDQPNNGPGTNGPAAASTRVATVPNANFTVARTDAAQSFTGDQTLSTGNLVVSNGKGIDFSATPGTGTSELLADYEIGTWTPVLARATGGAITGTYETQIGYYTKIGNLVTINAAVTLTTVTVQGSGANSVTGLPYNPVGNLVGAGAVGRNTAFTTDVVRSCAAWSDGNLYFYSSVNSGSETAVAWKAGYVFFTLTYQV